MYSFIHWFYCSLVSKFLLRNKIKRGRFTILPAGVYQRVTTSMRNGTVFGRAVSGVLWTTGQDGVPRSRSRVTGLLGLQPDQVMGGLTRKQLEVRRDSITLAQIEEVLPFFQTPEITAFVLKLSDDQIAEILPRLEDHRQALVVSNLTDDQIARILLILLDNKKERIVLINLSDARLATVLLHSDMTSSGAEAILHKLQGEDPGRYTKVVLLMLTINEPKK